MVEASDAAGAGHAVTVRGLTPDQKSRLRVRAAHNARSMEAEARSIIVAALQSGDDDSVDFGSFSRALFAPIGGAELAIPPRGPGRPPPRALDAGDGDPAHGPEAPARRPVPASGSEPASSGVDPTADASPHEPAPSAPVGAEGFVPSEHRVPRGKRP